MPALYKYLSSQYVDAFVNRGEILFRALSYFRSYEELHARGDRFEGTRLYQPSDGLQINKIATGETIRLPWAFEAKVREREIFVFSMSLAKSAELAREFGCDSCIEIHNPTPFLAAVRAAAQRRPALRRSRLLHAAVEYYSSTTAPQAAWAVPEQIVMRKTDQYARQSEYRLAFALGDALAVNNVSTQITATSGAVDISLEDHPKYLLKVGSLRRFCTVHSFM